MEKKLKRKFKEKLFLKKSEINIVDFNKSKNKWW